MCTVSAEFQEDGYSLLFNRDERNDRPVALPPKRIPAHGEASVPFLSPVDPQGGGTWLAVNEAGLLTGLLNLYREGAGANGSPSPDRVRSRGLLVRDLAGCPSLSHLETRLRHAAFDAYPSFLFFAIDPTNNRRIQLSWDRNQIHMADLPAAPWFLATSAYRQARVIAARKARFERERTGGKSRLDIHLGHGREAGPEEIRMRRSDARTVSISHILISGGEARFEYYPVTDEVQTPRISHLALKREARM